MQKVLKMYFSFPVVKLFQVYIFFTTILLYYFYCWRYVYRPQFIGFFFFFISWLILEKREIYVGQMSTGQWSLTTWLLLKLYSQIWSFDGRLFGKISLPQFRNPGENCKEAGGFEGEFSLSRHTLLFSETVALMSKSDFQLCCCPAFYVKYEMWFYLLSFLVIIPGRSQGNCLTLVDFCSGQ